MSQQLPSPELNEKLKQHFSGRIVRKDLTKRLKQGANVPVYVLEYLLGMYCASDDENIIQAGMETVKKILADNYVRPDEAQKTLSKLRELGSYTVIDVLSVKLNLKKDRYETTFSNLGIKGIPIAPQYPAQFDRLLCGGIWCIAELDYFYDEADTDRNPVNIRRITPIQMPSLDLSEVIQGRQQFTKEEWIDVVLRSTGMEPGKLSEREKWLHLARLIPLVENNFNFCELGPRSTGKSHIYKEISPFSILVSGGQTTVANLFYNMASRTIGLVGLWDCVAFDEVAGIKFKDQDGVQIMKDYMASGSFSRGKEEKAANASMVFIGNINQSVDSLLRSSHLFDPFPEAMANDTAFLDRMHCYNPGWEIVKYKQESFTDDYGFITDYLAGFLRELRKTSYADLIDRYFKFGRDLNQRDVIAVRKMVSGLVKLVYPDGKVEKDELEVLVRFAMESRRRVKEQLKRIGGMEFYDVNFSYIDNETFEEEFVSVPEQSSGKLIPEGTQRAGHVYTVARGKNGMIGVFKLETEMTPGSGRFERTGLGSDKQVREAVETAYSYLKLNSRNISGSISLTTKDYLMHAQDLGGHGMTSSLSLATLIALCSCALNRPVVSSLAILGSLTLGGTVTKVEELANILQVCLDSGAKKVLLPIASTVDMPSVPAELMGRFSILFYSSPEEAVFKALGVE
ncbi:MAG: protease Lon-related BREX system protein BrxL [Clostridiaceae bacterium]|jgi:ATP-dependent Lon protease|nr:protease Lon-related BREX system protein BrxL [Clostridiaceae bacterium]